MQTIHATCVAVFGDPESGCLLLGPSGAGKSDLALRLIDGGAVMVADDRVIVTGNDASGSGTGALMASAPPVLAGLMEMRGIGVVQVPFLAMACIRLVVRLTPVAGIDRMPVASFWPDTNGRIPCIATDAAGASAAARIRFVMRQILADGALGGVLPAMPDAMSDDTGTDNETAVGTDEGPCAGVRGAGGRGEVGWGDGDRNE